MKKGLLLSVILCVAILSFSGCGNNKDVQNVESSSQAATDAYESLSSDDQAKVSNQEAKVSNQEAKVSNQEATEKNSSALKDASVGDIVKFGSYEQDSNSSNGKEEIEWLVLAKESDRILIISKYALDCQQYNTSLTDVTWETCSLRKWLNGTFISNAFNSDEQKMIQTTTVMADKNPSYSTLPGNNTTDKVFLLSIPEADKYFSSDEARRCAPTDYAKSQGAYTTEDYSVDDKATCLWLLRTPGDYSDGAAYVNADGSINFIGFGVARSDFGVRPSLWVYYGSETIENKEVKEANENNEAKETEEAIENISTLTEASVGDIVKFGVYEQDNNPNNGKEEIEWKVLAKEGDKALIISKYILDWQPYNTSTKDVTWETCSLRKWLNGVFSMDTFSFNEQKMIQTTTETEDGYLKYGTSPWYDTTHKVFLLSITEANKYFSSDEARRCAPTEYALAQEGANASEYYSVGSKSTCSWWLRSPDGHNHEATVGENGKVSNFSIANYSGITGEVYSFYKIGVRPALWINLGS